MMGGNTKKNRHRFYNNKEKAQPVTRNTGIPIRKKHSLFPGIPLTI